MPEKPWTADDIPELAGKTIVVTGANSGIGYAASLHFARKGARVILACRSVEKAGEAIKRIHGDVPDAALEPIPLDLADLASVRAFARTFEEAHDRLDVLVNNGGVMALPYARTIDGFESQMGTNHFGHFALTGLLLPCLLASPKARVVTVTSLMYKVGRIDFDDIDSERGYQKWTAYARSKLANLLFTFELQRRFEGADVAAISVACHPGYASTNLQRQWPRFSGIPLMRRMSDLATNVVAQDASTAALPTAYAATASHVDGGDFIGPGGFMGLRGPPGKTTASRHARDEKAGARLWTLSVERTGVRYDAIGDQRP